jgi:ABC-type multidrug transport system ATPase subunit
VFLKLRDAGLTICMVTHDAAIAGYADRVVIMEDGRLTAAIGFEREREQSNPPPSPGSASVHAAHDGKPVERPMVLSSPPAQDWRAWSGSRD